MIRIRCSTLPLSWRISRWGPLQLICRIVVVLAVLTLAVVLAWRGYAPEAITGPVLVLVVGAVAAADRLVDGQGVRAVSEPPAL